MDAILWTQDENGCFIPQDYKPGNRGYCRITIKGVRQVLHRYVWELVNGEVADGMVLDHLCRNRGCCNVAHLRLVTMRTNSIENSLGITAINARKTHCKNGHEYTEENTMIRVRNGATGRGCRRCNTRTFRRSLRKQNA